MLNSNIEIIARFMGWEHHDNDKLSYPEGFWMIATYAENGDMSQTTGAYQLETMEYSTSWDWAMKVYVKLKDWKTEYLKTKEGAMMLPTVSTYWRAVEAFLLNGEDIENFADVLVKMINCRTKLLAAGKQ